MVDSILRQIQQMYKEINMAKCKNCGAEEEDHQENDGTHCENYEPKEE